MIDLAKHHLERIDQLAAHHASTDVDIVSAMLMELGPEPTQGEVTAWLWEQLVDAGLERNGEKPETPEAVAAWENIEATTKQGEPLTVEQVRAIVECGKPRRSSVKLDWGTP